MALYPLLPITIGLALLVWTVSEARRDSLLAARGTRVRGQIAGYEESRGTSRIVVRFHTDDGDEVLVAHDATGWTAARAGNDVTVTYDPAYPQRARVVEGAWVSHWLRGMLAALGGAMVLIGLGIGVSTWS
ncbi:DUF3592 domain-containing protein [Salinactinospora qingdaonensis]|uniref:DUF3592 domain-containing protein n=1 Tax=Salinactinospora qingdaonensis TaxID=702744 RepID=UPI0031EF308F